MLAAQFGHAEVVKLLMAAGADIRVQGSVRFWWQIYLRLDAL
jgi:hypothetical protein